MDDMQKKFDDTRDHLESEGHEAQDGVETTFDETKSDVDAEWEQAQHEIAEAKEAAKRDWDLAYSDEIADAHTTTDHPHAVADDVRADVTHHGEAVHDETGSKSDDAMSAGKSVVEDVQEKAKGLFNRVKDVFDGDKK